MFYYWKGESVWDNRSHWKFRKAHIFFSDFSLENVNKFHHFLTIKAGAILTIWDRGKKGCRRNTGLSFPCQVSRPPCRDHDWSAPRIFAALAQLSFCSKFSQIFSGCSFARARILLVLTLTRILLVLTLTLTRCSEGLLLSILMSAE